MQYFLSAPELARMRSGLQTAMAIPFIDDIEDYILEAIWEYTKEINGVDPFYNIRSKKLYDVVDAGTAVGWSVKSLQWPFYPGQACEFELVIQRADVYKKAAGLGFPPLSGDSDPNLIGEALLKHWAQKVLEDAQSQGVTSKRIMVLLKTADKSRFAVLEEDIRLYRPAELSWRWTNSQHNGLQGIRNSDGKCVYRWYPSQKQFFERFLLPENAQALNVVPQRLTKEQVVDILRPYLPARPQSDPPAVP